MSPLTTTEFTPACHEIHEIGQSCNMVRNAIELMDMIGKRDLFSRFSAASRVMLAMTRSKSPLKVNVLVIALGGAAETDIDHSYALPEIRSSPTGRHIALGTWGQLALSPPSAPMPIPPCSWLDLLEVGCNLPAWATTSNLEIN
jgi:hypothetical protein